MIITDPRSSVERRWRRPPIESKSLTRNRLDHGTWRSSGGQNLRSASCKQQGKMTEYEKLELLHSQLDELINGNQLPVDELKILQSFVEDIREKHLTSNKLET